ncbi:MAG: rRNA maturation RNase YbeY [Paracoccaceae bacterium]|jgi:probable rRNA maturation factor|nr:rRNA maturation RNase YbeY [Paracoccaceae bacterium]
MTIDTICEDERWETAALSSLAESASDTTLQHLGYDQSSFEIALLGCDDSRITALNADFREKPQATNVLSWPSIDRTAEIAGKTPTAPQLPFDEELGDIAISYDTCRREAEAANRPFSDHVTHLIVHGVLHLLGYDHIRDSDATLMERIEVEILGKMGIGDPYMITEAPDASYGQD